MLHGGVAGAPRPGCGMAGSPYGAVVGGVGVKGSVYSVAARRDMPGGARVHAPHLRPEG